MKILFKFWVITLFLFPFTINAQYFGLSYQEKINNVDNKIQNLMSQRKLNHAEQDKINSFVTEAGGWLASYSSIQNKINQAKAGSGDFSTFNKQRIQQIVRELELEKNTISGLNGGTTIQGVTYHSIDVLKSKLSEKSNDYMVLVNEDNQIGLDLRSADIERDQYLAKQEPYSELDTENALYQERRYLQLKKFLYQDDYKRDYEMVNNPNFWCGKTNNSSSIKCIHKKVYVSLITSLYVDKLIDIPGKKFNQNELIMLINRVKSQSDKAKQEALATKHERSEEISLIQQELDRINKQLMKDEILNIDPTGCWVIVIGKGKRPEIDIQENTSGEYDAYIIESGSLDYKVGKRLFTMARINSSTFEGTEYSHTKYGKETRLPLRLIMKKDRKSANYRTSDDQLLLLPCW